MMKGIIKQYITQLKELPYLRRITASYILTGCALLLLFAVIITGRITSDMQDRTSLMNSQTLEMSCNTGDVIFSDIHTLITKNIQSNSTLADAMYGKPAAGTEQINREISKIVDSSSMIDSVYIINLKNDIVYSSDASVKSAEEFPDSDIIKIKKAIDEDTILYYPRLLNYTAGGGSETRGIISCIYNSSDDGAVVINLSRSVFESIINPQNADNGSQTTTVINSSGYVLSSSQSGKFASSIAGDEYFAEILSRHDDSGSFMHDGRLVNYVRSPQLGFYYVTIADSMITAGDRLRAILTAILFAAALAVLYAAASIYIASASLKPVPDSSDASDYEEPAHDGQEHTEYKNIQYNFLSTKKSSLIRKLIQGSFTASPDECAEYGIIFDKRFFGVVMARIDRMKEIEPSSIPIIKYGIMNMGDEVLSKVGRVYSIEPNEYDIVWVINYDDYHKLMPAVEQVQNFVASVYKITASFGCNFGADSSEDLSDLYHNAQYSLSYRLSKGYNSIILYNSIKDNAQNICEYPEALEKNIIADMTKQNKESMDKNIHKFMEAISPAPYSTVIMHANRLLSAVEQIAVNVTPSEDIVTVNNIEIMTRMETISEIESYVCSRCESVLIKLGATKTDSKKDVIANTIIEYIDEHFRDSNLSIDMIANVVNRSANYTRSIFKQSQGISISDYISNKRFDEVCRLLLETSTPAQEIGKQIGLNSGSYFYTAFKKHTGYTPDQYRKVHQHSTDQDSNE